MADGGGGEGGTGLSKVYGLGPGSNRRLLRLRVLSASDLARKDIFGASDPYVRVDLIRADDGGIVDTAWYVRGVE